MFLLTVLYVRMHVASPELRNVYTLNLVTGTPGAGIARIAAYKKALGPIQPLVKWAPTFCPVVTKVTLCVGCRVVEA